MTNPVRSKFIVSILFVFVLLIGIIIFLNMKIAADIDQGVLTKPKTEGARPADMVGTQDFSANERTNNLGAPGVAPAESGEQPRTTSRARNKQDSIHEAPLRDVILVQ